MPRADSFSPTVITIDGPAGAGKSTVAKKLAEFLNYSYIDTGAMYRALTVKALRQGIDLAQEDQLVRLAKETTIELNGSPFGLKVSLDGEDVTEEIRSPEVTSKTFYVARAPRVREIMVQWQRLIGGKKNIVMEGRDIGTVVFPNATVKFYLDAGENERARRRAEELKEKGEEVNPDQLKQEIKERDNKDKTRDVGALKQADDATYIDSTDLSVDEVVQTMLKVIRKT